MPTPEYPSYIIFFTGPMAVGKTEIAAEISKRVGCDNDSLSDHLQQRARDAGFDTTRASLGAFALELRQREGDGVLLEDCVASWRERRARGKAGDVLCVSGHCCPGEFHAALQMGAYIVHLTAPASVREQRLLNRADPKDHDMSHEAFQERDREERLGLAGPHSPYDDLCFMGDRVVDASRSFAEVSAATIAAVDEILASATSTERRAAIVTPSETGMQMASRLRRLYADFQLQMGSE